MSGAPAATDVEHRRSARGGLAKQNYVLGTQWHAMAALIRVGRAERDVPSGSYVVRVIGDILEHQRVEIDLERTRLDARPLRSGLNLTRKSQGRNRGEPNPGPDIS